MTEIISGIKESLKDIDAEIIVKNAHADSNILLAIIKQITDQDIDVINSNRHDSQPNCYFSYNK